MGTYQPSDETSPLVPDTRDHATKYAQLTISTEKRSTGEEVPQKKSPKNWRLLVACILGTELGERLTFYSVYANLVLFCTNVLMFSNATALSISQAFSGTCYIVPVIGGWIADSISGRFNAIYGSSLIYIVGVCLLPLVALDHYDLFGNVYYMDLASKRGYFLFGIFLIAIGTGGIKPNVSPLGAKQVETRGQKVVDSFFRWFYWFVNMGAIIAYTAVAYVQQNVGFAEGFAIPMFAMLITVIVFFIPRSRYVENPPRGSVITKFLKIIWNAYKSKQESEQRVEGSFLNYAKLSHGGNYPDNLVDIVKGVMQIFPIYACLIIYFLVNIQSGSQFLIQAEVLNLELGSFVIPAASLSIFNALIILLMVPLFDKLLYPLLDRYGYKPSQLKRIGIGMLLTVLAGLASVGLEVVRKQEIVDTGGMPQEISGKNYTASHLSVLWQVPQYGLLGAGEVFTSITAMEFTYMEVPQSMQGCAFGVYYITLGVGSYLGLALINIVNAATAPDEWIPDDINEGHLEYYFLLSSALLLFNFLAFVAVAKWYKYSRLGKLSNAAVEIDVNEDRIYDGQNNG